MTKVIVGMSGGVDSSVAAYLLLEAGYTVEGLFMKNWEEDDTDSHCSASVDVADAQRVCERLGIPLHTINFAAEYWDRVFEYFLQEYRAGRTPNPDILCNKEIKFKAFLDYAEHLGADCIATGHYVRKNKHNDTFQLLKGLDPNKDQSYFLYTLNQAQLSKSLFPIGDYKKSDIRKIAEQQGFENHNKKDSTGICFIGERKFKTFLQTYLPAQPGNIETPDKHIIGQHDGLMYHTLGQRQGLHIGGLKEYPEAPWYVVQKDLQHNVLVVAQGNDHPLLFSQTLICDQLHWVQDIAPKSSNEIQAKTRYRQADQHCTLKPLEDGQFEVHFAEPQRAVTPGQSVVFYHQDECLGGGIIKHTK